VADGTPARAKRLGTVLTSDRRGVLRHARCRVRAAIQIARERGVQIPGLTR